MIRPVSVCCSCLAILLFAGAAQSVIEAPRPLKIFVDDSNLIVRARVTQVFADKQRLMFEVEEHLKGKTSEKKLPVVVKLDLTAKEGNFLPTLLKRFGPEQTAVLFIKERGKLSIVYGCLNGSWFHMTGTKVDTDKSVWSLISGEPNLRGTYKGTTADLEKVVGEYLAGKATLPAPNDKEKPGFGPEYESKKSASISPLSPVLGGEGSGERGTACHAKTVGHGAVTGNDREGCSPPLPYPSPPSTGERENSHKRAGAIHGGPLFAVIPTLGVGGPLAILALLFPTVFGGVFVLFRQWMAFITLLSINSMLLLLHWFFGDALRGSWWGTPAALWFAMTFAAVLCTLWAWGRQLSNITLGAAAVETPRKTENLVLAILGLVLALAVGLMLLEPPGRYDTGWNMLLALAVGIWIAGLFRLLRGAFKINGTATLRSTEGVILGGTLLAHLVIAAMLFGGGGAVTGVAEAGENVAGERGPEPPTLRWEFQSPDSGLIVSNVLVHGDRVYAAAAHPGFKVGTLYCLDRHSNKKLWEFIGDGELKEMISSPTIADGRLYMGEGFHDDPNCRLWCLDATTGDKIWDFQTKGQTESSPAVYAGKVYFGAGNDGFYCLNALTKEVAWRFPAEPEARTKLRFCASPVVVNERVYVGTGVDRNHPESPGETAFFCLDAHTGKELWKVAVDVPVWAGAAVYGDQVFVALGNGDIFSEAETPRGAVLCLDAKSGKEAWRYALSHGVLEKPAVDEQSVYVGCRNHHVYCLKRVEGTRRWKTDLGSPIVASPALAQWNGQTDSVFAVATKGKVCALDPHAGTVQWTYNLSDRKTHLSSSPRVLMTRTSEGDRRHIYFGAGLNISSILDVAAGKAVVYCLEDKLTQR